MSRAASSPVWRAYRDVPAVRAALSGFAAAVAGAQAVVLLLVVLAFAGGNTLAAGVVLAARSLPYVLAAGASGWLYDRFSVRRLVVATSAAEAVAVLVIAATREPATWLLAVGAAAVLMHALWARAASRGRVRRVGAGQVGYMGSMLLE